MKLRTLSAAAAVTGVLAAISLGTTPAFAIPPGNGTTNVLALAGSDTIQDVDTAIAAQYTANNPKNPAPKDKAVNIPALSTAATTVPADDFCEARTYSSMPTGSQIAAPNGSSAGKAALKLSADNGDGCIDIARSSSARGSTDPSTFEYYAFARDAVSFVTFAGPAPVNLTLAQLRGIYDCTFTNFSQVGGKAGAIQRYIPQDGSGTRSFFISSVLGGADPTTVSTASCPAVKTFQENTGTTIPTADRKKAVAPYSAAQFIAQGNKVITDARAASRIGAIDGKNPVIAGSPLKPNATVYRSTFIGARDVFHVVDTRSPSYNDAIRFIGFDAKGPGALCSGNFTTLLNKYGFVSNAKSGVKGICRLG